MIEIRFQGRGGNGVVMASEILARACFDEGGYPQSYSIFGGERRGAPVAAFVRISDQKINLKCDIEYPDHLVMFDPSVFSGAGIRAQLKPGGTLLVNSGTNPYTEIFGQYKTGLVNAREIAEKHDLGAIINTAVLGAYAGLTGIVGLDALLKVISHILPAAAEKNIRAAKEAYETVTLC